MPGGNRIDSVSATPAENGDHRPAASGEAKSTGPNGAGSSHHSDVPSWNGPQQAAGVTALNGDPFTNGSSAQGAKLNGQAVSFNPVSSSGLAGPISYLNDRSEATTGPLIVSSTGISYSATRPNRPAKAVQRPVGTPKRAKIPFSTDVGPSVTVPGGHYMKLEDVPAADYEVTLKTLCDDKGWKKKLTGFVAPPSANGQTRITVWLAFDDMRDAVKAIEDVENVNSACQLSYIPQTEYACGIKTGGGRGIQEPTSFYDGQIMLLAKYESRGDGSEAEGLYKYVRGTATHFGDIVGVNEKIVDANIRHYHIEFFKISDAKFMALSVTGNEQAVFQGWTITAMEIPDSNLQRTPQHAVGMSGTPHRLARGNGIEAHYASPTGRTAWAVDKEGNMVAMPGQRQLPKCMSIKTGVSLTPVPRHMRGSDPSPHTPASPIPGITYGTPRSGSWPSTHTPSRTVPQPRKRYPDIGPNRIDVERIQGGIDVRTTIMVRNIPNDMTFEQFKTVLDKVLFGRYNFVYLRFDFTKNTNVGYAFVNFLSPGDVLVFYNTYCGKEYIEGMGVHPKYGPRLGEIAYATCQGEDCSIEKFRNSSIMCEYQGYRPKVFYTVYDAPSEALIGQEKEFPGVNNVSKHNRSKDNAAHIGLYAPKHRQGNVAVRASQYDRGTTAQMQEDAYFQQQQMIQQSMAYGYPNYMVSDQQATMQIGMPASPFAGMYGPQNPYNGSPHALNGVPEEYSPTFYGNSGPIGFNHPQWNGSPGSMMASGVPPSRLRTITHGRLGNGGRPPATVRPPRDYDTAIREIEEGKRMLAEFDAQVAAIEAQEAAEAEQNAQSAEVPRSMHGEQFTNGHSAYYDANGTNGGACTNGDHHYTSYQ